MGIFQEEPTWSALRDGFTMGAQTMKDWDKDDDSAALEEDDPCTDSDGD